MMEPSVAIIGAGIAGLAAAYHLKQAAFHPVVFEKASFAGGRMSSERVDGFLIEKAAYTFPEFHQNLTGFLSKLGMVDNLVPTPGTSSTFVGHDEYEIKIGSPTDFLRYKLLSIKNKKDMIKLFARAQVLGSALDLLHPTRKTFELETRSATEYLLEHYDREILEYIAYPIFCEIFLGVPERNSMAAFLATIKNLTRFKILSFLDGMGMLPDLLMHQLDVRLNTPVLEITGASSDGPFEVSIGGEKPESRKFDAVIMAVPAPQVPHLVIDLPEDLAAHFRAVEYTRSIVAAFGVDEQYSNTSMINNLVRGDFPVVGTLVFDRHKTRHRVPSGQDLLTAILSGPASSELFEEPDDRIGNEVCREVDRLFPDFSDRVLFARIYRWEYGAVQLPPGALQQKAQARAAIDGCFRNLCFAGDGLHKSSLEVSFNTGVQAAQQIIGATVNQQPT